MTRGVLVAAAFAALAACDKSPAADTDTVNATSQAPGQPPAAHAPPAADDTRAMIDTGVVFDTPVATLDGDPSSLAAHKGKVLLVVNVASKCGLTPQYEGLEKLHKQYSAKGFSVVGFPCNQFGGQEPGSAEEIETFCSLTYGVTFPMFEKIEVNGEGRHAIYSELTKIADETGEAGDVKWNFEKFLVSTDGKSVVRFSPRTEPYDEKIIAKLESWLPE